MHVLLMTVLLQGGQTSHTIDLAIGLKRLRVNVSFLLIGQKQYPALAKEVADRLKEYKIPIYTQANIVSILPYVDIFHAHSSWTFELALKWSERYKKPVVFTIHDIGFKNDSLLSKADTLIAVGRRTKDELPKSVVNKTVIITNGVDLGRFKPPKKINNPYKVLYLSRLTTSKELGLKTLAEAVDEVGMELYVASDKQIDVKGQVKFLGWVEDVAPLLQDMDIVFAVGRALREGMASSLASFILGRKYGGLLNSNEFNLNDLDLSGFTGVEPNKNTILKDLKLLKDENYLKSCQKTARLLAEKLFSLDAMAQATLYVYETTYIKRKFRF